MDKPESMDSNKILYENLLLKIDEAIVSEVGEEREFSDETDMILDEVSTMLKEALNLPEDFTL